MNHPKNLTIRKARMLHKIKIRTPTKMQISKQISFKPLEPIIFGIAVKFKTTEKKIFVPCKTKIVA